MGNDKEAGNNNGNGNDNGNGNTEANEEVEVEATEPWDAQAGIPRGEQFTRFLFMAVVGVITGAYLVFPSEGARSIWVLFNVTVAYGVLQNPNKRRFYWRFFGAFKEKRIWGLTIVMLAMILVSMSVALGSSETAAKDTEDAENPFVSNFIFILAMLPIVPLFAFAETLIFQAWIAKLFFPESYRYCRKCRAIVMMGPNSNCSYCGKPDDDHIKNNATNDGDNDIDRKRKDDIREYRKGLGIENENENENEDGREAGETTPRGPAPPRGPRRWLAIILSGLVFGGAHALLIGSWIPMVLAVPGVYMAHLYFKEGYLTVTKVHLLYDYIILGFLLLGTLLMAIADLTGV